MSPVGSMTVPTARCSDCAQVWLVPGLRPGEGYACKGCGRTILISGRESSPAPAPRSETEDEGGEGVRGDIISETVGTAA